MIWSSRIIDQDSVVVYGKQEKRLSHQIVSTHTDLFDDVQHFLILSSQIDAISRCVSYLLLGSTYLFVHAQPQTLRTDFVAFDLSFKVVP